MVFPGQAVSYKVGEIKLWQLRRQASKRLGSKFGAWVWDQHQRGTTFHHSLLRHRTAPITLISSELRPTKSPHQLTHEPMHEPTTTTSPPPLQSWLGFTTAFCATARCRSRASRGLWSSGSSASSSGERPRAIRPVPMPIDAAADRIDDAAGARTSRRIYLECMLKWRLEGARATRPSSGWRACSAPGTPCAQASRGHGSEPLP